MNCVDVIGGHFNPFNADLNNNYATECTPFAPLRCESGDLSGKHLKLNISAASPTRPTYTYVDNNLHLWGPANYSSETNYYDYKALLNKLSIYFASHAQC